MLFERRKVKLGLEQDGRLQIRDGLKPGDRWSGAAPSSSTTNGGNERGRDGNAAQPDRLLPVAPAAGPDQLAAFLGSATRRSPPSTSRPIPTRRRPSSRSSRRTRPVARGDGALRHDPDRDRRREHAGPEIHHAPTRSTALSFIRLQFEYGRDYYFVRQQTINRLKDATLPPGCSR